MVFARVLVVSAIIGLAAADSNIILPPVNGATDKNPTLLVFVPGGDVPNQVYAPLLKQLQTQLADKFSSGLRFRTASGIFAFQRFPALR